MKIKSVLLALAISAVSTASVFSQGLISFQNVGFSQRFFVNNTATGGTRAVMPTTSQAYTFYVVYGTSSDNMNNSSLVTPVYNSTSQAGILAGNTSFTLPNAPGGTPISLRMYAFETAAGDYATASTVVGFHSGVSQIITVNPATAPSPGTVIFANTGSATGSTMEAFDLFVTVPEPSTIALGVLGMAGLVFIRRRK